MLVRYRESPLSRYLGLIDEEWVEMDAELNSNTDYHDEMSYCYWLEVPEDTPQDILNKTGWKVGDVIDDIPVWVVDTE